MFSLIATSLIDGASLLPFVFSFLKTLFLFTKSDFKTILIPVTVFAATTAPHVDSASGVQVLCWTWLHCLHCALANQSLDPDEDALNKPDRPIPSGRVTVAQTRVMRWACIIPCLALSAMYSTRVVQASAALAFFLYIYNELKFNAHWLSRNFLNGAGLACFEVGATLIAGRDRSTLDTTSKLAIAISTSIFMTTIHTQDFKDLLGDEKIGRKTLPMVFPWASRISVIIELTAWSFALRYIWNTNTATSVVMVTLSSIVGARFLFMDSIDSDQKSFYLYNVWLTFANSLPALTIRAL
ncbi:UbiA prenyltransferase family [Hysterangium stoloniferum]|nr:UbiA prenyltransferase family [Hysterangium stoloniferum]